MDQAPGDIAPLRSDRTDSALKIVLWLLLVAVLGLGAFFAVTVIQTRQKEASATPAQRALLELREFARKNPNSAGARVRYGEALASAGKLDEAAEQFKAAVKIEEDHTGAWLDLGIISMQTEQFKDAERYFQKVIDLTTGTQYENLNARRETALFHLGEIALDDRRYEDAAGFFKEALRIRRDASDTYYLLAQALHGLDKDDGALERLEAAVAFDPNYGEAHFLWGQILLERKDKINAAVHLAKAAELAPDRKEVRDELAKLGTADDAIKRAQTALEDGQVEQALEEVLLARALDPDSVNAAILHAQVLVNRGDKKIAKKVVKEALALDPNNTQAKQLQASLGK